jgi:hypothetical protein
MSMLMRLLTKNQRDELIFKAFYNLGKYDVKLTSESIEILKFGTVDELKMLNICIIEYGSRKEIPREKMATDI